jgi:hypothetical protein
MKRAPIIAVIACALLSGCAMFVSKDEYRDYRAVRLAPDDSARLIALQRYASRHDSGLWADEVERERAARDMPVFESGKHTRAGLELYLKAFPDGTFASQARSRLTAIDAIEQRKKLEQEQHARFVAERKQRDEELRRTWVERFATYWVRTLATLEGLGTGIEDVAAKNADFSRAFGRSPRPRCSQTECVKSYESGYAVPVPGGTRIERAMRVQLRLHLKDGRLTRAELLMPSFGFSRWREVQERRAVIDADATDRSAAVSWAFERLSAGVQKALEGKGKKLTPEAGYVMAAIAPIQVETSFELTDTTAEDPSAPAQRVAGAAEGGAATKPEPSVRELTQPKVEPSADMELAPMQIDASGRAVAAPQQAAPAAGVAPAAGEEMVFEPMAVPPTGGATQAPSAGATPAPDAPAQGLTFAPPRVEAFRVGSLRVVIFAAAAAEQGPAYDGALIELAQ